MATREQSITAYENEGALLTIGKTEIIGFSSFQTGTTGELVVADNNNDLEWDLAPPETATFGGQPATLVATGTVTIGIRISVLGLINLPVSLSTPVNVGVFEQGGVQYVRFYNEDGTDADPAQLLDGLLTEVLAGVGGLLPLVEAALGPLATYVEQNALLTFNLPNVEGVALTCFTTGTLIATQRGEVRVEELKLGDLVMTLDHGLQPVRWVGSRLLSAEELERNPRFRPIRIEPGALGVGLPHRRLTVSPQHRCLLRSRIAERMTGGPEVLAAAKHLVGAPGITIEEESREVTYMHILFDRHELVWSNGAVTESFYLGEQALDSIDREQREEILALFPELAQGLPGARPEGARPFMRGRLARKLVDRSRSNGKPLVEAAAQPAKLPEKLPEKAADRKRALAAS